MQLDQRSTLSLWTDPHISQQMLAAHLDPLSDGASRNAVTLARTADWVLTRIPGARSLLDLGCGPGLYAERFAGAGLEVTGVDISTRSIEHARQSAQSRGLIIEYLDHDYLELALARQYDAVTCIYCDFGALTGAEQTRFLDNVKRHLKADGRFIFDVFGHDRGADKHPGRTWSRHEGASFWSARPHYLLEETCHFPAQNAWGQRHVVIDDGAPAREYLTWDRTYSVASIAALLETHGFEALTVERGPVEANGFASSDVWFVIARKAQPTP